MNPNMKLATMFIVAALGTIGTTATSAFAAKPTDANCWGDVSSDAATTQGREFGEHASDPTSGDDQPRSGLPNVLDSLNPGGVPTPRDPEHPSEVGEAVANC